MGDSFALGDFMFKFSDRSEKNKDTLHPNLIVLFDAALKTSTIDFSIICGYRDEQDQNEANDKGFSALRYPHSKHNQMPSLAGDIQPYPYTQEDIDDSKHTKFRILNEHIKKVAADLEIPVINEGWDWGWDWFHWELVL